MVILVKMTTWDLTANRLVLMVITQVIKLVTVLVQEMLLVRVVLQISKTLMNFHKILEQIVLITIRNMNL